MGWGWERVSCELHFALRVGMPNFMLLPSFLFSRLGLVACQRAVQSMADTPAVQEMIAQLDFVATMLRALHPAVKVRMQAPVTMISLAQLRCWRDSCAHHPWVDEVTVCLPACVVVWWCGWCDVVVR